MAIEKIVTVATKDSETFHYGYHTSPIEAKSWCAAAFAGGEEVWGEILFFEFN